MTMKHLVTVFSLGFGLLVALPSSSADDEEQKLAALEGARIGIVQAIQKLEQQYQAVAVEIEIDSWRKMPVYEAKLFDGVKKQKIEVTIDVMNGEVLKENTTKLATWLEFDGDDQLAVDASIKNHFGLTQALELAQKHSSGVAYGAELSHERGVSFAEIKMQTATGKQKVIVDIENKSVVPVLKHD
jgi:uncharacterized membrane protein YkoI